MSFLFEFVPLGLFLATMFIKGIYPAIAVLMIAMPIGLLLKYLMTKKLDKMYLWSTIFLLVAGALTLYFENVAFVTWKPTVFYWVIAGVFLGSQFIGEKPMVQRFFGLVDGLNFEKITRSQWRGLNLVWVAFFVFAGVLNIYVAGNYDFETWATFKVFGLMGITFVFMLAQTIWMANKIGDPKADSSEGAE